MNAKYWRTIHKYGVRLPKSTKEAFDIDQITGIDFWEKSMNKKNEDAKVSYEEVEDCRPNKVRHDKFQN